MDVNTAVGVVPVGLVVFVLTLLPLVAGLLVFAIRTRLSRKGFTVAAAWALTVGALWLFLRFALHRGPHGPLLYSPPLLAGALDWNTVVAAADLLLLAAFVGFGLARRSPLVVLLAVAQLVPVAWLEFGLQHGVMPPPAFLVDWLAIVMVSIVSIIGSIIAVYALPYMRQHEEHLGIPPEKSHRPRFFLVMLAFLGAMNGLAMANNLLWLYFFWEVTTLCSFLLIGHDGTDEARANAYRALWMNLVGGVAFVAGIWLVHGQLHTLSVQDVLTQGAAGRGGTLVLLAMAFLCLAGFTKSAQMPFQTWLLGAMVAPTPVSALLHSSTMVKAGVYLVIRFAPCFHGTYLSYMVAAAGAFTFAATAFLAIGQTNAKKVLAYSTVSNLGLIIACAGLNTPLAVAAAVMLLMFHAISKGLLFMAAGVVEHNIHSRDIEDMQGLVSRMPLTTMVMVIGILSMLLPPFGVLIAKLAALESSVVLPPVMFVLVLGSTFTVVFWVKWVGRLLISEPQAGYPRVEHLHNMYFGPLLLLTAGAIVFSLCVIPVLTRIVDPAVRQYYEQAMGAAAGYSLSGDVLRVPWLSLFAVLGLAVVLPMVLFRARPQDVRPAYLCGEQASTAGETGFLTVAETRSDLVLGGSYYLRLTAESRHLRWMTAAAAVLMISLFGMVYLCK